MTLTVEGPSRAERASPGNSEFVMYAKRPWGATFACHGLPPGRSGTVATTLRAAQSMTLTLSDDSLGTSSRRLSGVKAGRPGPRPLGSREIETNKADPPERRGND